MKFKKIATHHDEICESLFQTIVNDNNHRLYKLLPAPHESTYSLRRARPFNTPRLRIALLSFHVLKQLTYRLRFSNFAACISVTFFGISSLVSFFIPFN